MLEWSPPTRLVFGWRQASFPDERATEVAVQFDAVDDGTRVTVEHFGWDAIPQEHAARHGFPLGAFQQRAGRVVAGAAAVARDFTSATDARGDAAYGERDGPPPRAPIAHDRRRHRGILRPDGPAGAGAEPRRTVPHAGDGRDPGCALDPHRRPRGLPVRLGRQLRPRRQRRPALLRQHDGGAHPERTARPARQPARHRTGARGCRSPRQRTRHVARPDRARR